MVAYKSNLISARPTTGIAVLPFENLSQNKEDEYFADGVQDDILTKLAKISQLKVISRSSVLSYRGARNIREIGRALNVSHVLEGSVRKEGGKVHLNTKLIDARTDSHVWAEEYDRYLHEVFVVQSDIAQKVAQQLHARISSAEKQSIERAPTADLAAYDLYSKAKTLLLSTSFGTTNQQNMQQAIDLLNQAVARDPSFFEAYYQLAYARALLYAVGDDRTAERLAAAEASLQAMFRLQPDAGETHLAKAQYLYYCRRDYNAALAELEAARPGLPNDPRIYEVTGYILRRRGQQEEGVRNLEKAIELDPRNYDIMQQMALSYQFLRRYADAAAILDRALTIVPKDVGVRGGRALVDFFWKADTRPLHEMIDSIRVNEPGTIPEVADHWFMCALAERDPIGADGALASLGSDTPWWGDGAIHLSRSFGEGLLARMMKDEGKAQVAFTKARAEQEKIVQAQPDYGPGLCLLGLIDAALGRKDAALEEGRRAIELLPVEKDTSNGSRMIQFFALTAAWTGEKELALQQLERGLRAPSASIVQSYGALKLLPFWDPLRGDIRFEKIVDSLAPKS